MSDFYIADPTDTTYVTKLVDFLEYDVGGTGFNVADGSIDFGIVSPDQTFLHQPPAAGGLLATQLYPEVEMSFNLLHVGADYQDMVDRVLVLDQALSEGGTIVWQPTGADEPRYIDYYPASLSQMFRGQAFSMQKVINMLKDSDGLPVSFMRFPYFRGPDETIANAVSVTNTAGSGHITVTNPGNAPSPMKMTIDPISGTSKLLQVRMGRRSTGDLTDFVNNYQFDPTADESDCAKHWKRMWKHVITPAVAEGLVGNYRVVCSIKLLEAKRYSFQLRWGNVNTDPMGATNNVVPFDNTDYNAWDDFADVPFGKVRYDDDGNSLTLEMWGIALDDDAPTVDFGTVTLIPADEQQTNLTTPGFRSAKFGREDIYGPMFDTVNCQVLNDETVRLIQTDSYCEYDLGTLPSGQHVLQFRGHLTRGAPTSDDPSDDVRRFALKLGEMTLRTGGSAIKTVNLRFLPGHPVTHWDHDNPKRILFTASGSDAYKVRVQFTEPAGLGRRLNVYRIVHWFIPYCDNGRVMVMDSYERETYIANASGDRWLPLHAHGALMKAAPGEQVIVYRLGYASAEASFHDADNRGPLSRATPGKVVHVTILVSPYYTNA